MLASWQFEKMDGETRETCIGHFNPNTKTLRVLYRLEECVEVVQATVNSSVSLLAFVVKKKWKESENESQPDCICYFAYITEVRGKEVTPECTSLLKVPSRRQVLVQFLWRTENRFDKCWQEKLLVLTHGISEIRCPFKSFLEF